MINKNPAADVAIQIDKTSRYLNYHSQLCTKMREITEKKNHDYTGGTGNPFKNFTNCEELNICTTEQGFLVRMSDKISRLSTFVNGNIYQVEDEKVEDTLLDLSNYCLLFLGYLNDKKLTGEKK